VRRNSVARKNRNADQRVFLGHNERRRRPKRGSNSAGSTRHRRLTQLFAGTNRSARIIGIMISPDLDLHPSRLMPVAEKKDNLNLANFSSSEG